jgi:hypothetical protein
LDSGNQWKSTPVIIGVLPPDTAGEKMIRTTHTIRPP